MASRDISPVCPLHYAAKKINFLARSLVWADRAVTIVARRVARQRSGAVNL